MRHIIRKAVVAGIAACFATVGLVGCGQQEEAIEEEPIVEEQPVYDLVIGAESEEVVDLPITNDTEKTIVGLQFKLTDAADFSANVMTADQAWEQGQTADIFFEGVAIEEEPISEGGEGADDQAAQDEAADADEALLLNETYDLQLTTSDGGSIVLHQLSLTGLMGAQDITLKVDPVSGLGYITYLEEDAEVSTLEGEQAIAAAAAEAAEAEAEAAAQAAAEAGAEAAAQRSQSSTSYSSGSSSSSGSGSSSYDSVSSSSTSSSAPTQTEDTCIDPDDLALN